LIVAPKTCIQLFQRYKEITVFQYFGKRIKRIKQHRNAVKNPRFSFQKIEPFGSASFSESTALSSACSIIIRLRACCLVASAKKTLAGFRLHYILEAKYMIKQEMWGVGDVHH